jgi:hypothetical protein
MTGSGRLIEYVMAAGFAAAAFIVSPPGIELLSGRADLSFRIAAISLAFAAFLAAIAAAVLAQGWLRRVFFYAVVLTFPFAALAAVEAGAVAVHLADVVAPLEDTSLLADKTPWPKHLLSESSYYTTPEGLILYRPWSGGGVTFNALGLRTAMPTPKAPGEWRIAVTGGSAAWGWHVVDAGTIAARLQEILRRSGHRNVTVYNFGIGGATLNQELTLLKRFRADYGIDQALFYTGANDVYFTYLGVANKSYGGWAASVANFEVVKTALRLSAMWSTPSPEVLQHLDNEVLPAALKAGSLRTGIAAADEYCRGANLRCDFVLQPVLSGRTAHSGAEAVIAKTLARVYPRLDLLAARMYADALAAGPAGHIFDLAHIFDATPQPLFLDFIHVNEEGHRIAAEEVAPIVAARLP